MNRAAQSLGRLAKGVPKDFSSAEIAARKQRLAEAREDMDALFPRPAKQTRNSP